MKNFMIFVDGSNLVGSMDKMNLRIPDYGEFFKFIFSAAHTHWDKHIPRIGTNSSDAQLVRVYWYTLGTMDEWDFKHPNTITALQDLYKANPDLKSKYLLEVGKKRPTSTQCDKESEAWNVFLSDIETWYGKKKESLNNLRKFQHALKTNNDFIDVVECGHWKVDMMGRHVMEKGVDTTLAVDIVRLADYYDVAIVISGDADTIPSIEHAKRVGKHCAIVEFLKGHPPESRGRQMASKLRTVSDFVVQIYETDLTSKKLANAASHCSTP